MDLGPQLLERRTRLGFSIQQVAALAGLSPEEVEAAERPGAPLGLVVVHALGDALAFDPGALLRGEPLGDPRRLPGWFRSHDPGDDEAISPKDARLFARAAELGEVGKFLWRELERGRPRFEDLRIPKPLSSRDDPWREGYELGEDARIAMVTAKGPMLSVQAAVEDTGVHVALVEFDSNTREAVSIYRQDALPVILLNNNVSRVRYSLSRRAVIGHELCHLLHDSGERPLLHSDNTAPAWAEAVEQRANGFAPAFLAPPRWVRGSIEEVGDDDSDVRALVAHLAATWGFTWMGAVWHAKNCELIPGPAAERLAHAPAFGGPHDFERELPRRWDTSEPESMEVTSLCAGLIGELALDAADKGIITSNRAREILSWS
jgi:transcriptional regulator with XRE-family HTH domain